MGSTPIISREEIKFRSGGGFFPHLYTFFSSPFLSATMNYLKMDMNDDGVTEFIQIIKNNYIAGR
jgi:hypothetical protein